MPSFLDDLSPQQKRELLRQRMSQTHQIYPLSYAQERMWFLEQWQPNTARYHIHVMLGVSGQIDIECLQQCLSTLAKRHDVLRTTFPDIHGKPMQQVSNQPNMAFEYEDAQEKFAHTNIPFEQEWQLWIEGCKEKIAATCLQPFNMDQGPLWRVKLLQCQARRYILLFVFHHIISDATSLPIFLHELLQIYTAEVSKNKITLPPPTMHYGEYAQKQQQAISSPEWQNQFQYWQKQLAGHLAILDFPKDTDTPNENQNISNITSSPVLSSLSLPQLQEFCAKWNITPFMLLVSIFQSLLYRYLKQPEFLIATPISQRTQAQYANLLGLMINTIVLRLPIAGAMAFQNILEQNRKICMEALSNSDYPIEKLLSHLQIDRNTQRNPLFQIMLDIQEKEAESQRYGNLHIQSLPAPDNVQQPAKFDLHLSISHEHDQSSSPTSHEWQLRWSYDPQYIEHRMVESLNRDFSVMVQACLAAPQQKIDEIVLWKKEAILDFCNQHAIDINQASETMYHKQTHLAPLPSIVSTPTGTSKPACITDWIIATAKRTPDATAVVFESQSLTYQELLTQSQRLAQVWRQCGATSESVIAVCLPRSLELPSVLLSILLASAVYWPMDSEMPEERLTGMLQEASPVILITCRDWRERISYLTQNIFPNLPILDIAEVLELAAHLPDIGRVPSIMPDQAAYLIYTSGSTGRPKGVLNSHRGLANRLQWMQEQYLMSNQDRVLQKTTYTFDVSVWEFFLPLVAGATLVLAKPGGQRDPAYLANLICQEHITVLHFVPSMLRVFLDEPGVSKITTLRYIMCSGEALSIDLLQLAQNRLPAKIENLYGPTEAAIDVTYWHCTGQEKRSVPIGWPISNIKIYILDHNLDPVPDGMIGELAIAGIGLARGYIQRADLTAKKFVPNPLSNTPGERMYLTGDLARVRQDGSIEFLGRKDFQVKWRGFRIELGEIETTLRKHHAVSEAVVMLREDVKHDPRLVAYIVLQPKKNPTHQELRAFLKQQLPEYMLPSHFVYLPKLPLSPSGKLDHHALPPFQSVELTESSGSKNSTPEGSITARLQQSQLSADRGWLEDLIIQLLEQILQRQPIQRQDDFFELGGHSLLAVQVVRRLQQQFKIPVPLQLVFQSHTPMAMAEKLNELFIQQHLENIPRLQWKHHPNQYEGPLGLSQQSLWLFESLYPATCAYHVPLVLKIQGTLDLTCLQRAWSMMVQRHSILRTVFSLSQPLQRIVTGKLAEWIQSSWKIECLDSPDANISQTSNSTTVQAKIAAWIHTPFDLEHGPLFRLGILQTDQQEFILVLVLHHLISDGWSLHILYQEWLACYNALVQNKPWNPPELSINYLDIAQSQQIWCSQEVLEHYRQYWQEQLQDAEPLELPWDFPRPQIPQHQGARQQIILETSIAEKIREVSRQAQTTEFITLLAGFQIALACCTGQSKIMLAVPFSGRTFAELENIVGMFVNDLVIVSTIDFSQPLLEFLHKVSTTLATTQAHQDIPLDLVVERPILRPRGNHPPLVPVLFDQVGMNQQSASIELTGLTIQSGGDSSLDVKSDLAIYVRYTGQSWAITAAYNTALFTAATIQNLLHDYQTILSQIGLTKRLQHLLPDPIWKYLPKVHEKCPVPKVLFELWKQEHIEQSIPLRFGQMVRRYPNQLAVVSDTQSWTYTELNRQANRIAQRLSSLRLPHQSSIALLVGHNAMTIAAIMGVLKAGHLYIPLDHKYPISRLSYILSNSQAKVLLYEAAYAELAKELSAAYSTSEASGAATNAANIAAISGVIGGAASNVTNPGLICRMLEETPLGSQRSQRQGNLSPREQLELEGLEISTPQQAIHPWDQTTPLPALDPGSKAYILYTSGSTGVPKGVLQNHRNVLHFIQAYTNNLHIHCHDRLTLVSSYTFDAAIMDIFAAILNGASLYMMNIKECGLAGLVERLDRYQITIYHSTPTVYRSLLSLVPPSKQFDSVRLVVMGGEATLQHDLTLYHQHFGKKCLFVNGLGPTESTVSFQFILDQETQVHGNYVPVGYPVQDTELVLLDAQGQPAHTYGEIAIRSSYVALEYWRDEEHTQKSFLSVPSSSLRIYRTGDMGRVSPQYGLIFTGRKDWQIKIRGIRIEPTEIEAIVKSHASVRQAVVLARDIGETQALVMYVVPQPPLATSISPSSLHPSISSSLPSSIASYLPTSQNPLGSSPPLKEDDLIPELRKLVQAKLPDFMVPEYWVILPELPLTPNGKLDRQTLPLPSPKASTTPLLALGQDNPVEEMVSRFVQELLRIPSVHPNSNLLDLGASSVLMLQLIGRIQQTFGISIPLAQVFELATVRALSRYVQSMMSPLEKSISIAQMPIPWTSQRIPLSPAQKRLWFLQQLQPQSSAYHIVGAIELSEQWDLPCIQKTLALIQERHEILRTTFHSEDGEPYMKVHDKLPYSFEVVNSIATESNTTAKAALDKSDETQAKAERFLLHWLRHHINLQQGPLIKFLFLELQPDRHILAMSIHHLISDGWSIGVLVQEFVSLYHTLIQNKPASLPPLPIQYQHYVAWQQQCYTSTWQQQELQFWREYLLGIPEYLNLPTSMTRQTWSSSNGSRYSFLIPQKLITEIRKAIGPQTSMFMAFFTAMAIVLYQETSQTDIVIGSPVAGRSLPELEPLIGMFVNTVAIRLQWNHPITIPALLEAARQSVLQVYRHLEIPFDRVVEAVSPGRHWNRTPIFQTMLVFQNTPTPYHPTNLSMQPYLLPTHAVKFDLTLVVIPHKPTMDWECRWEYNSNLFNSDSAARWTKNLLHVLELMIQNILPTPLPPVIPADIAIPKTPPTTAEPAMPTTSSTVPLSNVSAPVQPVPSAASLVSAPTPPVVTPSAPSVPAALPWSLDQIQDMLTLLWQDVLHVPQVQPQDNFFDLGGHSLLLIKVQQRIQQQLPWEIELLDLLKYPNIQSLAQFILQRSQSTIAPPSRDVAGTSTHDLAATSAHDLAAKPGASSTPPPPSPPVASTPSDEWAAAQERAKMRRQRFEKSNDQETKEE